MQRVPFRLTAFTSGISLGSVHIQLCLQMQGADQWIRIEKELQDGAQKAPDEPQDPSMGVVEGRVLEHIDGLVRRARFVARHHVVGGAPERFEKLGLDAARVQDVFETSCGELVDLLIRQLHPLPQRNARTDVAHDLLDIDMLAMLARPLIRRCGSGSPFVPASIGAAASTMEMLPAAVLWILISHRRGQYF